MEKNVGYTLCYKADMQCLFQLLLNREKDVVEVHKLFGLMFNVIWYLRQLEKATDIDEAKRIQGSVERVKSALRELMRAWCLADSDRSLIWSLVQRSV